MKKLIHDFIIRIFDVIFSLTGLLLLFPVFLALVALCRYDTGSPIFRQKRLGLNKKVFKLLKFRTMHLNAPTLATHLMSTGYITVIGAYLRRYKLDELPQLWNVVVGQMSLVGPRPCLLEQKDIVHNRDQHGIFEFKPGMTGLAQIRGVDMSKPKLLAELDFEMMTSLTIRHYFYYILLTVYSIGRTKKVSKL